MIHGSDDEDIYYLGSKDRLFHLSIREAAELVAIDMWVAGEFPNVEEPDDWGGSDRDPRLLALLGDQIKQFEELLFAAVDSGRLKAKNITRNFDESLIENRARIRIENLERWLNDHGYEAGEVLTEWIQNEAEIASKLEEEFDYLRALSRTGKGVIEYLPCISDGPVRLHEVDSMEHENLVSAYKALVISHDRLATLAYGDGNEQIEKADAKIDRPLTTRGRRTLLTIIAALCKYSSIDTMGRSAAGQIAKLTEAIDANVTDETIAKALAEIPDALETRMK